MMDETQRVSEDDCDLTINDEADEVLQVKIAMFTEQLRSIHLLLVNTFAVINGGFVPQTD